MKSNQQPQFQQQKNQQQKQPTQPIQQPKYGQQQQQLQQQIQVQDKTIIIRIKSNAGFFRLENISLNTTTFAQLKQKISEVTKIPINNFTIINEEQKIPLNISDIQMISKITPQLIDGVSLKIEEIKVGKKVEEKKNSEPPKLEKKNSSLLSKNCNHLPEQRCINCLSPSKPIDEKSAKSNCNHGPDAKCLNCIDSKIDQDKNKKKEVDKKWNCQHGPNGKCTHCMGSEFLSDVKHINFDAWIEEKKLKCKGVHKPEARCNNCLPPSEISYQVKRDCKNHAPYPEAMCNNCLPPSIIIKRQEYRHVDYAQFMNAQEISNFVQAWQQKGSTEQRVGFLYGYYCEDPNYQGGIRAVIEAIYEPSQKGDMSNVTIMPDEIMDKNVDRLAEHLNLERIGWIFTSINHDTFLSSEEIRKAAKYQQEHRVQHQTGYTISKFITVVLRTAKDKPEEIYPEVYMVSDQAQAMERENLFTNSERRKIMKLRQPKDEKDVIPGLICQGKQVTEFEPDFFIVNVAHGHNANHNFAIIKHYNFPIENRQKQDEQEVKKYMQQFKNRPSYDRFSDFHLLLYLSKKIDLDTILNIAYSVANEQEVNPEIDDLLKNIFKY